MKKALKVAFLYIGTMVGAGFSSGREIALFFGELSPINVAIAAIFMTLFAFLFLTAGKYGLIPKGRVVRFLIFFSASISFIAMLAGGEYILRTMTGVPLLALIMALLSVAAVSAGIEKIKIINTVLVPLIVLSIALIFFQIPHENGSSTFSISKPIIYSGLDVLLGGIIIGEEGKNMKTKEIVLSCLLVCMFLFAMLYMLQTVVLYDKNNSLMPVFAISESLHMQAICGVLIAAAIFTTLISSLKIVSDSLVGAMSKHRKLTRMCDAENKPVVTMFCLVVLYPLSFFGFGKIVNTMYPINSILGVFIALVTLLKLVVFLVVKLKSKKLSHAARASNQSQKIVNLRHPHLS